MCRTFTPRSFKDTTALFVALVALVVPALGCGQPGQSANWLKNGLIDPTQTGNFEKAVRLEIRGTVSVLDEPIGIQDAEEPTEEDVRAVYEELTTGVGDFLKVTVFELVAPGLTSELQFQVRASGYETFPVVGPMKVAGFTPRDLELEIKSQLRERGILDDADVQVTMLRSESQQYSIVGGVSQPGNYPLPRPNFKLLNALAAAGGLPPAAETVIVIRNGADGVIDGLVAPESQPAMPQSRLNQLGAESVRYTMSDVPMQGGSRSGSGPPTTGPTTRNKGISELEILEGGPRQPENALTPVLNPWTGEWELQELGATTSPEGMEPTSGGAISPDTGTIPDDGMPQTFPATTAVSPEEQGADIEEMLPGVRILEIPAKALREGDPRYNVVIRPSDLIDVPIGEIGEYYMYGNVSRSGAYQLTGRKITVKQAIASAGGFGPLAWPSRADLIRRVGKDEEQFIQIDLDAIFAGSAPDFYLRPNDIVNVGSSPIATFMAVLRNAFRFSYGFGFVYDRNFADSDSFGAKEQIKQRRALEQQQRGLPF